ncbi:hypothetical protein MNBD_PLANCTO02-3358 [hydrothermal vent metagenome]|uniref:Serine phosphatase RsbU, regulator of sigma subunit n=1 Tax=hydrothermal vent metagenome TaxID=652676 RepID=A0A3B1DP42_9ZZZZ
MISKLSAPQERNSDSQWNWIHGACRRFFNATGWRLVFVPADPAKSIATKEIEAEKIESSDTVPFWKADVHDGQQLLGRMQFDMSLDSQVGRTFLAVCELAEMLASLFGKLASATETAQSREQDVSTLVDVGLSVSRENDVHDALNYLLSALLKLTRFRATEFFLLNASTSKLTLRGKQQQEEYVYTNHAREFVAIPPDLSALAGETVIIQRSQSPELAQWLPDDVSVGVCVAVKSDSEPLGTLWAYDRRNHVVTDREVHILESIAAQIATLLERIVLLKESHMQHRLQRDLQVASSSQGSLLHEQLPDQEGFDAKLICNSAFELGGDFCELLPLTPKQTLLVLGDASGDGVSAAMVMSAVRGAIRSIVLNSQFLEKPHQTASLMEQINKVLHDITPSHQFMSILIGVIDTEQKTFSYTNAGHPLPLLMQNGELAEMNSHGMLLGVMDDTEYEHSVVNLNSNDLMVLYTDGISEAMSSHRQMFRSDGVLNAMRQANGGSAHDVLETIWERLEKHRGPDDKPDDRTLLVLKFD